MSKRLPGIRRAYLTTGTAVAVGLLATAGLAEHNDAETFFEEILSSLVTGYENCAAPNDLTNGAVQQVPACHPAPRSDAQCGFDIGPAGENRAGGKVLFRGQKADNDAGGAVGVLIHANVNGITGFEGETLCPILLTRPPTDSCPSGDANW